MRVKVRDTSSVIESTETTPVSTKRLGGVAVVTITNPPVNALSHPVRVGLLEAVQEAADDDSVDAIVIACAGRTFSAGADINEFGAPLQTPLVDEISALLERCGKVSVAAIHGTALGGGLELALSCHHRVSLDSARMGLPEVTLGIIPGAGGTQRLPRLIGLEKAVELITTGDQIGARDAAEVGLVDALVEGDVAEAAARFAEEAASSSSPAVPVRDRARPLAETTDDAFFETARERVRSSYPGQEARIVAVDALEAAATLPFEEGLARERELVLELLESPQAKALQYVFFAERAAAKVPDIAADTPVRDIRTAAVIGAGTMGGGIATALANAGIPVVLVEQGREQLDRGVATITRNWTRQVERGRMTDDEAAQRLALVSPTLDVDAVAEVDIVIEAVFEQMAVKKEMFATLERHVRPGGILGTNTSTLDIDEIASVTERPEDVIGLHFFSPAHVMRLLEVVRGARTSDDVVVTSMALGRRIRKVPVLVGVCDGFVGNRMIKVRETQASRLLLEGASPRQVDDILRAFGFPMGSFEMQDMAGGIDVLYRLRQETGEREPVADRLFALGRWGIKTDGKGYYSYEDGRTPIEDPVVLDVIEEAAEAEGVARRSISDEELRERLLYPLINEGAKILDEGIASRATDIDVIYVYGYGWPATKGGPMYHADQVGLAVIRDRLRALERDHGPAFTPSPLLERLADEGGRFTASASV